MLSAPASKKLENDVRNRPSCKKHGPCGAPRQVKKDNANKGGITSRDEELDFWEPSFLFAKACSSSHARGATASSSCGRY